MIPRVFHRGWIGSDVPKELEAYWQTWRDRHPDWMFVTWREKDIDLLGLQNRELYERATKPAFAIDVVMYEVLYHVGGVWLDCDMECCRNIAPLIEGAEIFCGHEPAHGKHRDYLLGAIMGATPKHWIMRALIDGLADSQRAIAPVYLTDTLERLLNLSMLDMYKRGPLRILAPKLVYPYFWWEKGGCLSDYPDAYCCHHWYASWVDKHPS